MFGTQKALPDKLFQNVLFLILDFHIWNKRYFRNFKNMLGAGSKVLGVGRICQKTKESSNGLANS